jgi:hypothetical protein
MATDCRNALKVCNPFMPPLQTLLCAAYSTPTDRALGWLTDVEGQTHLLPCGFWQLIAEAAGALGAMQQSQTTTNHNAPLLNQDAVRSLLLSSSLSHAQLISLGQSSEGLGWSQCGQAPGSLRTPAFGSFARCSWRVLELSSANSHPIRAAGHQWPCPSLCHPPRCCAALPSMPLPHLAYTLGQAL